MSVPPTVADALAGARYAPASAAGKTALVAGASSRLGERILARLLSSPAYRRVYVLAANPMPSSEPKLTALPAAEWDVPIDDVIAVVDAAAGGPALSARQRSAVFTGLPLQELMPLARSARLKGTSRFMAVTPINVLAQPAALYGGLANLMETELHQLDFAALFLVRPSDRELRSRRRGIVKRLTGMLIDTAGSLMAGKRHAPLSIDDSARAIVRALQEESGRKLTIIETDHLHGLLGY